jgi:ankyrin repeat protein
VDSEGLKSSFGMPNTLGEPLLHRASAVDNIHAANWAFRWYPEIVDVKDKRGRTPLFHAAAAGSAEICKILIAKRATVNTEDILSRTPLHAACRHGHYWVVALLFWTKQSIPETSSLLMGAWHFAALSGSPEVIQALRLYTKVSDKEKLGLTLKSHDDELTPLHLAASNGYLDCVVGLCDVGFSVNAKSKYTLLCRDMDEVGIEVEAADAPKTAEEWAEVKGYSNVAEYLKSANPLPNASLSPSPVRKNSMAYRGPEREDRSKRY